MKKRTLTLWLMSSALLLNLSVGTALADEVVETGADNSPKVEATESTPVEQPSDSQEQSLPEDKEAPAATESVTLAESEEETANDIPAVSREEYDANVAEMMCVMPLPRMVRHIRFILDVEPVTIVVNFHQS